MSAFPALSSGTVGKYPISRARSFRTVVYYNTDLTEQRFAKGAGLDAFELVFTHVNTADKEIVRAFFNARQGSFDTTWTLTLNDPPGSSTTWHGLQFIPGSSFDAKEVFQGIWDFTLQVRQTRLT